jgi:hypothetical protein
MPPRTLIAAIAVVTIAMVSAVTIEDLSEGPPILMAPIVPAMYLLWSMFTGGPHGVTIGWYQQAASIFVIGVAIWWAIFEICRRVWNRMRPQPAATRPRR